MNGNRFFFYGTLVAGSSRGPAEAVHRKLRPLGPATVPGRLIGIPDPRGWYPALLRPQARSEAGRVHGIVYRALPTFTHDDLARIDAYESYDQANQGASLYLREMTEIRMASGRRERAHVYIYNRRLPRGAARIESGNFASWLAERGHKALGG